MAAPKIIRKAIVGIVNKITSGSQTQTPSGAIISPTTGQQIGTASTPQSIPGGVSKPIGGQTINPVQSIPPRTTSRGGGGSSVGGNQLSISPEQARQQDVQEIQRQRTSSNAGLSQQQKQVVLQRREQAQQQGFSGRVEESFKGQRQQQRYFVRGEETGRIIETPRGAFAQVKKPSTFTFKRPQEEEAVQFTNEGFSSAMITKGMTPLQQVSNTANVAVISGVPKTGNVFIDTSSYLRGKSRESSGYYGEGTRGKFSLLNVGIGIGTSVIGTAGFLNSIRTKPVQTIFSIPSGIKQRKEFVKSGGVERAIRTNPSFVLGYVGTEALTTKAVGTSLKPISTSVVNSKVVSKLFPKQPETITSFSIEKIGKGGRAAVETRFETNLGRQGMIRQVSKLGRGGKSGTAFAGEVYDLKYSGNVNKPEFISTNRQTFVGGIKSKSGRGTAQNVFIDTPGFKVSSPVKVEAYVGRGSVVSTQGNVVKPIIKFDRYGNIQIRNVLNPRAKVSEFYSKGYSLPTGSKQVRFVLGGTKVKGLKKASGFAGFNFRVVTQPTKQSLGTITKSGKSYLILSPEQQAKLISSQKAFRQLSVASVGTKISPPITTKSLFLPVPKVTANVIQPFTINTEKGITGNVVSSYTPKQQSQYYGTGLYERTSGGQSPVFNTQFKNISLVASPSASRSRVGQIPLTLQLEDTSLKSRQNIIQSPASITKTNTSLKFNQLFRQSQAQRFRQIQITTLRAPQIPKPKPFAPRPKTFLGKSKPKSIATSFLPKGFSVFGKRFGKFKLIGTGKTEQEAFNIGKDFASKTLGVTFTIPSAKNLPKNIFGFKSKQTKQGKVFIEIPSLRLSKKSETSEINLFRAMKGGQKKKR